MIYLFYVIGTYNFDINAEEGLARLQAIVEPNYFMKALSRTGPHAEPKYVKINHPRARQSHYYDYDMYNNGYSSYSRALPDYSYNYMTEPVYPYYPSSITYYPMSGLPRPRYVASYPP